MNFNTEAVTDLKAFHTQLNPESEWNMSIDTLLRVCLFVLACWDLQRIEPLFLHSISSSGGNIKVGPMALTCQFER